MKPLNKFAALVTILYLLVAGCQQDGKSAARTVCICSGASSTSTSAGSGTVASSSNSSVSSSSSNASSSSSGSSSSVAGGSTIKCGSGPTPSVNGPINNIYPGDNEWNRNISADAVDPSSKYMMNALLGLRTSGKTTSYFRPDFGTQYGIPYNVVSGTQAKLSLANVMYYGESDVVPMPIPLNPAIEGGNDAHMSVLDQDNCLLYELWQAKFNDPTYPNRWIASSETVFDLKTNTLRQEGYTSADAAGLPILPGLVRYEEVQAGAIKHALRMTVWTSTMAHVHPATHSAHTYPDFSCTFPVVSSDSCVLCSPPMGARLRLKASYVVPTNVSKEVQVVLTALKQYGAFVADNGPNFSISGTIDPRWNDANILDLYSIAADQLEVVQMGHVIVP